MRDTHLSSMIEQAETEAQKRDIPGFDAIVTELKGYVKSGASVPAILTHDNQATVIQAQQALQQAEGRIDRVLAIQFNVKVTLQALSHVEGLVLRELVFAGKIPPKASGPAERRVVAAHLPVTTQVRGKLELIEDLCTRTQKRLGSIRDTIKLMSNLDDNLRWAQYRQPG